MAVSTENPQQYVEAKLYSPDASAVRISAVGLSTDLTGLNIANDAANDFRVSALVDSGSISAKSAAADQLRTSAFVDSGSISAKSGDGGQLRISAIQDSGTNLNISCKSGDAGLCRVSAVGVTVAFDADAANNRVSAIGATLSLSGDASGNRVSCVQADAGVARISAIQEAADKLRVSAVIDSGSISAKCTEAAQFVVSGKSLDGGTFRVSAIQEDAAKCRISALGVTAAFNADAANNRVSAIVDSGSISAKSPAADAFRVSAFVDSGSISAKSAAADSFRVSAFVDSGSISAKSAAADTFRVSASIFGPKDSYTGAIEVIEIEHEELHGGVMFRAGEVNELDANETRVWEFITPAVSASTKRAHLVVDFAVTGDTETSLYEAPTISADGTLLVPYNRNRTTTTNNILSCYYSPNITSVGTTLLAYERFGSKGLVSEARGSHEWILSSAKTYVLSCKSNSLNNEVTMRANWYEVTN